MPVGSHGHTGTLLPSSPPAVDPRITITGGSGAGMEALGKGLSEPHGFESQVSVELKCHHG